MCLCRDVLHIQIKKWYVKFGATGSLTKVSHSERGCAPSTPPRSASVYSTYIRWACFVLCVFSLVHTSKMLNCRSMLSYILSIEKLWEIINCKTPSKHAFRTGYI